MRQQLLISTILVAIAVPFPGTRVTAGVVEGFLEKADCTGIDGWAWDSSKPNDPVRVHIFDGTSSLGIVQANLPRTDLVGKGDGFHGFHFAFPEALKDEVAHSISVKVAGSFLLGSPKRVICINPYDGYLDGVDCKSINGWAWNNTTPETPIDVKVYSGSSLLLTASANLFRPDLAIAGKGKGFHAFHIDLPPILKDGATHNIHVKYAATNKPLSLSPRMITCANPYEGYLDRLDCTGGVGWAWDNTMPDAAINVDIYDDIRLLATVPADLIRIDLSGIGNGKHAFQFDLPESLKDGNSHVIRVKFAGTWNDLNHSPEAITYSPQHCQIAKKYASMGKSDGVLGSVSSPVTAASDGVGYYQDYQYASIYWSPDTGAHEVHGLIWSKWTELGRERSYLGYPVSDELPMPNGVARFSHFQGGSLFWSPDKGIHEAPGYDFSGLLFSNKLNPALGVRPVLAILWDWHDPSSPAPSAASVDQVLFGPRPSVSDWYNENSGGKFRLKRADVLGWYDADKPASHYQDNQDLQDGRSDNDASDYHQRKYIDGWFDGHAEKWAEAIRRAEHDFDFASYDTNHDGSLAAEELSILIVIPKNGPDGYIRPPVGRQVPEEDLIVDGVKINDIAEWYTGSSPLDLATPAHEISHLLLGTQDLYIQDDNGPLPWPFASNAYSIMDSTIQTHLDPMHKLKAGWLSPSLVVGSGEYTLRDVETRGEALILYNPKRGPGEYFIIENRWRGSSYDAGPKPIFVPPSPVGPGTSTGGPLGGIGGGLSGSGGTQIGELSGKRLSPAGGIRSDGIAVWHILEDPALFPMSNPPNTGPGDWGRRGIRLIRANGGVPEDDAHALFNDVGNKLSDDTTPASLHWIDGSRSGFQLEMLTTPGAEVRVKITVPQTYFERYILHGVTALHESDDSFDFALADWDGDSKTDLVAIKKRNTGSHKTEVHILSGASSFQEFILHAVTSLDETDDTFDFAMTDWNADGRADLVAIKKSNNESRKTEIQIYSGASNFQRLVMRAITPLDNPDDVFAFALADWNTDGKPDLVAIKRSRTGSSSTEVHILSGASRFRDFILHAATTLPETDANWSFVITDWDKDGKPDLAAINKNDTQAGSTTLHILSGASTFLNFSLHTGTALHTTDDTFDFAMADWDGNSKPDLIAIKKSNTGSVKTEVHILSQW